jgi:hypothetical protein
MFEVDYPPKPYRHYAFKLLKIVTVICAINSAMLLFIEAKSFYFYAFIFPLTNTAISNLIFGALIIKNMKMHHKVENSLFIIQKYPSIWKKLHPWGKYSHNFIAYWNFIRGKYDHGKDIKLEEIKRNELEKFNFALRVNLLCMTSWALNFFFIFLKKNL